MAKDPAFMFYTNDFISGTQFFTDEQTGIYIRLLCAQHQHGRLSEKQVNFICKSQDKEVMQKFTKDDNGFYYNIRLENEISKRKSYAESRSNNRKGKVKQEVTTKKHKKKTSKSYDSHMEDENEDRVEDEFKDLNEAGLPKEYFESMSLWLAFKKEKGQTYKKIGLKGLCTESVKKYPQPEKFIEAVNHSISNNYTGIYAPTNNQNNGKSNPKQNSIDATIEFRNQFIDQLNNPKVD